MSSDTASPAPRLPGPGNGCSPVAEIGFVLEVDRRSDRGRSRCREGAVWRCRLGAGRQRFRRRPESCLGRPCQGQPGRGSRTDPMVGSGCRRATRHPAAASYAQPPVRHRRTPRRRCEYERDAPGAGRSSGEPSCVALYDRSDQPDPSSAGRSIQASEVCQVRRPIPAGTTLLEASTRALC